MYSYLVSPTCWFCLAVAFVSTLILTPLIINIAKRLRIVDGGGYRKINRRVVPLMGGLAIALPFIGFCIFCMMPHTKMLHQLSPRYEDLLVLGICSLLIVALGIVDDINHLSARMKFLVQTMVAVIFCANGHAMLLKVDLPLFGIVDLGLTLGTMLSVLWLVGVMNAFNLIDGVDGLASSLALIAVGGLGIIAAMNGVTFIVVLSLVLAGSLLAFLIFNFHPAKIFLGDTGSLFLGFVLAAMSLMGTSRASGAVMLVTPMIILALPIFDTLTSLGRRLLRGHNPFWGDRRHTHHRLLDMGLSQRQVALIMGGVSLLCTVAAILAQAFISRRKEFTLAIGLAAIGILGVAWTNGYLRLRHAMRAAHNRPRNIRMMAFANYAALALSSPNSRIGVKDVLAMTCKVIGLDFIEVADAASGGLLARGEDGGAKTEPKGVPDPIETIRIEDAKHQLWLIRFRLDHDHEPASALDKAAADQDRLEHEDVSTCLAWLFGRASLNLAGEGPKIEGNLEGDDQDCAMIEMG